MKEERAQESSYQLPFYELELEDGMVKFARSRILLFDTIAYQQLVSSLDKFVPAQARRILFETGYHNIRVFIDSYLKGELGTRDDFIFVLETLRKAGYGRLTLEAFSRASGECVLIGHDCFEANAIGSAPTPTDHMMRGVIAALMELISGLSIICEETKCTARADEYCQFETVAY